MWRGVETSAPPCCYLVLSSSYPPNRRWRASNSSWYVHILISLCIIHTWNVLRPCLSLSLIQFVCYFCLFVQKSRRHRDASSSEYDVEALLRQEITIAVKRGNYFKMKKKKTATRNEIREIENERRSLWLKENGRVAWKKKKKVKFNIQK